MLAQLNNFCLHTTTYTKAPSFGVILGNLIVRFMGPKLIYSWDPLTTDRWVSCTVLAGGSHKVSYIVCVFF